MSSSDSLSAALWSKISQLVLKQSLINFIQEFDGMITCNSRVSDFGSPHLVPIRKTWTVQWKELNHTGKSCWHHSRGLKLSNWEKNILFTWNIYRGDGPKYTVVQSSSLYDHLIWCNVFPVYLTICWREYGQFNLKQATGTELTGKLLFGAKAFIHVYV